MSDVPPEVMVDILLRIPVKSLLRFRSVSKSFCALIDSPFFINLHLNQPMKTAKAIIFERRSTPSSSLYLLHLLRPLKLETPFDRVGFFHQVLGCCNGLICLSRGVTNSEILLWNPSTRKYKLIKAIEVDYPPGSKSTHTIDGIGYDDVNDDYKIVRLSQSSGSDSELVDSKVIVYSLKRNIWQLVERDFPYYICQQQGRGVYYSGAMSNGVFVGGAIHWVATRKPFPDMNYFIVSFDLKREMFQEVPQPEDFDKYVAIDLGLLRGRLCVVGNHEMYCVDVWLMAKCGVKESWIKCVALTMSDVMMHILPYVRPIVYLDNEKEVILELDHEWFLRYDVVNKKCKQIKINGVSFLATYVCKETLV